MTYKVFLSSRNNDRLYINGEFGSSLTDIRLYLQVELEKERLFSKSFLKIIINENFDSDASLDSYNECLKQVEESNLTVALYNGNAGWGPDSVVNGICHAELARALEISQKQVAIIDVSDYFKYEISNPTQLKRDDLFKAYLLNNNRFNNPLKIAKSELSDDSFKSHLLQKVKELILKSIEKRIEASNYYFRLSSGAQKLIQWKGMNFENRNIEIINLLSKMIKQDYKDIITNIKCIPDHMATQEALSYTGRCFLNDQETITDKKYKRLKRGPLHFVGVYGNVTESQVRKLMGNPDVALIKEDFGIYVWERSLNIQMVFLSQCTTHEATSIKYNLFRIWSDSNDQTEAIKKRAEARHLILLAFIKAQTLIVDHV